MIRVLMSLLVWGGLALSMAGCAAALSTPRGVVWVTITEATIRVGDPLPVPEGPVVLTITGRVTAAGAGRALRLDMATLEALGRVSMRVDDQVAEGREVVFEGVLLSTLLAVAGTAEEATTLVVVSLNDTRVEIPLSDVRELPVLLATRVDGQPIPIDRYGPLRIVYPFGQVDLQQVIYEVRSIGHLARIEVH
ncbi:MAG TPA: molybdopterin-dependent oxidoreductase [Candidatus Limnocylindrales bacterium]|nr:molybdopterin-dependent oxidoreductase [Candidatus Limnocylindrales bacterium]